MNKKLFLSLVAICLLISSASNAQSTTATNVAIIPPQYIGYSGAPAFTSKPLDIKNNYAAQDIKFFTNQTGVSGTSVQRMTIKGSLYTVPAIPIPLAAAGFVGINTTTPLQRLHVAGDINLQTNVFTRTAINDGYRINNQTVLAVKNSNDLFVGFGAGASWVSTGVHENTFVGNNSGFSNVNA